MISFRISNKEMKIETQWIRRIRTRKRSYKEAKKDEEHDMAL